MDTKAKILLVDDTADGREPLAILLRMSGYDVKCAASGFEALDALDRDGAELVILDLMMPGLSGTETLERMRASKWPALPVMVLSASGHDDREAEKLSQLGVAHYLQKTTVGFPELLQIINGMLPSSRSESSKP